MSTKEGPIFIFSLPGGKLAPPSVTSLARSCAFTFLILDRQGGRSSFGPFCLVINYFAIMIGWNQIKFSHARVHWLQILYLAAFIFFNSALPKQWVAKYFKMLRISGI